VALIIGIIVGVLVLCGAIASVGAYLAARDSASAPTPVGDSKGPASSSEASEGRTLIVAKDGRSGIRIPPEWSRMDDLNAQAVIAVANGGLEEYLVVISEAKEDFASDFTLDRYVETCLGNMRTKIVVSELSPPSKVQIGGLPAVQYDLKGSVDGVNIGYVITFVGGKKAYHQVLAWTLRSKFEEKREKLAATTKTFHER
jgi:hypothetical protein